MPSEPLRHIRLAFRTLRRARGWSTLAVLTLALGIGSSTALFTVLRAALLQPLPYAAPEALIHLWETTPTNPARQLSYPDFVDLRTQATSFSSIAGYAFAGFVRDTPDGPQRLGAARVSANFFTVLGVGMQLGRSFLDSEDAAGGPQDAIILTDSFWRSAFGADPGAVGRTLVLDGTPRRVIGVLPAGFHFAPTGQTDVFATLSAPTARVDKRFMHWMWAIARLQPGTTLAGARAELAALGRRRADADARWHANTGLGAQSLRDVIVGDIRPIVLGLFGATLVVLLIAGTNLAGMSIARALERRQEMAVRFALGANRRALAMQLLVESTLVASAGAGLGLLGATWGTRALVAALPAAQLQRLPFLQHLALHPLVVVFSLAAGVATAIAFGVAPALRTHAGSAAIDLRSGRGTAGGRARLHDGLVIAEIALALVVLVAAGLFVRSIRQLLAVDPGFRTANLLTLRVVAPDAAYGTPDARLALFSALGDAVRAVPGVAGATWVDRLPLLGSGNTGTPSVVGRPPAKSDDPSAQLRAVGRDYFDVLGIPRLAGRGFSAGDLPQSARVVVVNRSFAERILSGEDPVGQRVSFVFMEGQPPLTVVGVVGDENVGALDQPAGPVLYFPMTQDSATGMSLMVRTLGPPHALAQPIRAAIRTIDPSILVAGERTLDEIIAASPAAAMRGYPALLLSAFAGLALLLAAIGLYGVTALAVEARLQEFGIRMALGATRSALLRLVLGRGLALAAIGVAFGLGAALLGARAIGAYLFGIQPWDPATLGATVALLGAFAVAACLVPAWRASRLSPLIAQRGRLDGEI